MFKIRACGRWPQALQHEINLCLQWSTSAQAIAQKQKVPIKMVSVKVVAVNQKVAQ